MEFNTLMNETIDMASKTTQKLTFAVNKDKAIKRMVKAMELFLELKEVCHEIEWEYIKYIINGEEE